MIFKAYEGFSFCLGAKGPKKRFSCLFVTSKASSLSICDASLILSYQAKLYIFLKKQHLFKLVHLFFFVFFNKQILIRTWSAPLRYNSHV